MEVQLHQVHHYAQSVHRLVEVRKHEGILLHLNGRLIFVEAELLVIFKFHVGIDPLVHLLEVLVEAVLPRTIQKVLIKDGGTPVHILECVALHLPLVGGLEHAASLGESRQRLSCGRERHAVNAAVRFFKAQNLAAAVDVLFGLQFLGETLPVV